MEQDNAGSGAVLGPSLTIFFPCFNDAGTIASLVIAADAVARRWASDYELLVIDDGSRDHSRDILLELQKDYPRLRLVFHEINRGYGAALKSGFRHASKELVFYTDGDGQYDVRELPLLLEKMRQGVDVVNGYKVKRMDPWYRIWIGKIYQRSMKFLFALKVKDVDCDFRLMRRGVLEAVDLEYDSGVICVEMIRKFQDAGFHFEEVGVSHHFRKYGRSQFFNFRRVFRVGIHLLRLWWVLVVLKRWKLARKSPAAEAGAALERGPGDLPR